MLIIKIIIMLCYIPHNTTGREEHCAALGCILSSHIESHRIVWYCTVIYRAVWCTVLYWTVLYCTVLHCIILYKTESHHIVLYYTIVYRVKLFILWTFFPLVLTKFSTLVNLQTQESNPRPWSPPSCFVADHWRKKVQMALISTHWYQFLED